MINLSKNLIFLRKTNNYSQEQLAEKIGVSRQAIAKWENRETMPDIINCDALATLFNVSLDNLIHYDADKVGLAIPPKCKHMFGTTKLGERGQIVLPKQARDMLNLNKGDMLVVLGDENPETLGIALVPSEHFTTIFNQIIKDVYPNKEE